MVNKQALFACTTPYQIMGAISIICSKKLQADLIIFGMFNEYEQIANRIIETKLFDKVITVAPDQIRNPGRKGAFLQMMKVRSIIDQFLPAENKYQYYYSSSRAHIKNLLVHELIRRNKELKIIFYDDGMGTYAKDSHVLNTTSLRKKAEKFLGWDLYTADRISFSVYEPSLFDKPLDLQQCVVEAMPKPCFSSRTGETIRKVFPVNQEQQISEKIIIFDSLRGLNHERDEKLKIMDKYYEKIVNFFGYNNVVLKPHPRSTVLSPIAIKTYKKTEIPMEVLYASMNNLNEKILITYASTAVYTPKLLFGAEPTVINLFRLVDKNVSEWDEQYEKFKSIYQNKTRMTAPQTMDIFDEIIYNTNTTGIKG